MKYTVHLDDRAGYEHAQVFNAATGVAMTEGEQIAALLRTLELLSLATGSQADERQPIVGDSAWVVIPKYRGRLRFDAAQVVIAAGAEEAATHAGNYAVVWPCDTFEGGDDAP